VKKSRGAVLSWFWLFARHLIFIVIFWFALDIGLRAGRDMDPPFFLWLVVGLIPWFFMRDMLGAGSNTFRRFSYLVNKMKFPLSGIPMIFNISTLVVHLGMVIVLFLIYFFMWMPFDLYLLQIPFIIVLMFIFFYMYSLITSLLSALSKDFANLVRAMVTPIFWVSGIIFNVANVEVQWVKNVLLFNPVTFFATAFRDALYYKVWVWQDFRALACFILVFLITMIIMFVLYRHLAKEVPDAL
jgi:teichoic acid transport system permease protein